MKEEIRWQQRLNNFKSALEQLSAGVALAATRQLSSLEEQGLIQAFEFTHELAWNVMRDYARYQGNALIAGSRDASREAFKMGLIDEGNIWMEMIKSRNQTSHTYNKSVADEIIQRIQLNYHSAFQCFLEKMEGLKE